MRRIYSNLMLNLSRKVFTITGEIEPLKTTNIHEVISTALTLNGFVTAVNITDNPQAFAYMNAFYPSYLIQEEVGLEAIYQLTCRDRNRLGLFSDLLAASAAGIRNVLALTGDHTSLGDNPGAKPVFDLDSVQLTHMIRHMVDEGVDLDGNKIERPPMFHVGVAANPNANPIEPEILKLEKKANAGAEFVQTQVVYDIEKTKEFLAEASYLKIPILIGICPLKSIKMAKWLDKECPGIQIPHQLMERLILAKERKGKAGVLEENIEVFGEFLRELKETTNAAGCHIMAIGFEWIVPKIVERAGLRKVFDWRSIVEGEIANSLIPLAHGKK
jgi:methylenetetrahydrofolate reductase (NADPH)